MKNKFRTSFEKLKSRLSGSGENEQNEPSEENKENVSPNVEKADAFDADGILKMLDDIQQKQEHHERFAFMDEELEEYDVVPMMGAKDVVVELENAGAQSGQGKVKPLDLIVTILAKGGDENDQSIKEFIEQTIDMKGLKVDDQMLGDIKRELSSDVKKMQRQVRSVSREGSNKANLQWQKEKAPAKQEQSKDPGKIKPNIGKG